MKVLSLLIIGLATSLNAYAFTPFTPNAGIVTTLDDNNCVTFEGDTFEKNPEIDYFNQECVGLGGWRLQPYGGDIRAYLKLINGGYALDLQHEMAEVGQFPNIGNQVEWRVVRVRGKSVTPVALLVEVTGQDPDDINKENGWVMIVKLNAKKSCVMNKLTFDAKDAKARDAAWINARTEADAKAQGFTCK